MKFVGPLTSGIAGLHCTSFYLLSLTFFQSGNVRETKNNSSKDFGSEGEGEGAEREGEAREGEKEGRRRRQKEKGKRTREERQTTKDPGSLLGCVCVRECERVSVSVVSVCV